LGSFNATCAISGLPIGPGDPVRYLLLSGNYSERGPVCMPFDKWEPRTFPIRAEYNDYGSIENPEEGIGPQLWLDGLKRDLVPQGWGDNSCHDVPTDPDMTWGQLLEALWEGRVLIDPKKARGMSLLDRVLEASDKILLEKARKKRLDPEVPEGVPTLERIKNVLSGHPAFNGWGNDGFMVDETERAVVRVRWHGQDRIDHLETARDLLNEGYAALLVSGSGNYSDEAEVLVFAKPGVRCGRGMHHEAYYAPRPVAPMMIREDVWQALLKLDTVERSLWGSEEMGSKTDRSLGAYKKAVRDLYGRRLKQQEVLEATAKSDLEVAIEAVKTSGVYPKPNSLTHALEDPLTLSFGWGGHWELLVDKALPAEEISDTLDAVAESLYVCTALMWVRYLWQPSHTVGPQFGSFNMHEAYHKAMAQIAYERHEEDRKQYEDEIDEEDAE